jgi:uncharacterized protein (TIGR03083 family)
MDTARLTETLDREGAALLAAAVRAGPDAEVPSCPGWQVRDLVLHVGHVHRRATRHLRDGEREGAPEETGRVRDDALPGWFTEGHRRLVSALRETGGGPDGRTDAQFAALRAFWARRQAHESAVHRVDAELAAGTELAPVAPEFAADGVDELLTVLQGSPRGRLRSATERVLRLRATDVPGAVWTVRIGDGPPRVTRGSGTGDASADCELSGPAGPLYLTCWNRIRAGDGLVVQGDASLVTLWQSGSAVE